MSRGIFPACDYSWNTELQSTPFSRIRPLEYITLLINFGSKSDRNTSPNFLGKYLVVWGAGSIPKAEADVEGLLDPTEALAGRILLIILAIWPGRALWFFFRTQFPRDMWWINPHDTQFQFYWRGDDETYLERFQHIQQRMSWGATIKL